MEFNSDSVSALEAWYDGETNGWWEHSYGITIETLDNPGWIVRIDLEDTSLENESFERVNRDQSERNWFRCWIEGGRFQGVGGPQNLSNILEVFADWASADARRN